MAKIPTLKKLKPSEFPGLDWMPRFSALYNQFLEETIRALSTQLTFKENFSGDVVTITLEGTFPVKIAQNRTEKPIAVWPGNLQKQDGSDLALASAYSIDWSYANGVLQINGTPGLTSTPTDKHKLTLIAVTG